MVKEEPKDKTLRILRLYDLLHSSIEVPNEKIEDWLGNINKRTLSRDIAVLKKCGYKIRYLHHKKAYRMQNWFNMTEEFGYDPNKKDKKDENVRVQYSSKKEQQFIEMIQRLTFLMKYRSDYTEPMDVLYKDKFPYMSKRTMQRDFKTLSHINYNIIYRRAWDCHIDHEGELPIRHYYYNEYDIDFY